MDRKKEGKFLVEEKPAVEKTPDLRAGLPGHTEFPIPTEKDFLAERNPGNYEEAKKNVKKSETFRPTIETFPKDVSVESESHKTKERAAAAVVGILGERATALVFNYVFCPAVTLWAVFTFGPLLGASIALAIITAVSVALDLTIIKLSNFLKKDLLGMESRQKDRAGHHKVWDFLYLSTQWSPTYATLFFRKKENKYKKLTSADYGVMAASTVLANIYEIIPAYIASYLGPMGILILGVLNFTVIASAIRKIVTKEKSGSQ